MKAKWEQRPLSLQTRKASSEFNFTDSKAMACMKTTVHVRVGKGAKVFWVLLSNTSGRDAVEGNLVGSRSVRLEDFALLPLFLIFLLNFYENIPVVSLKSVSCVVRSPGRIPLTFSSFKVAADCLDGSADMLVAISGASIDNISLRLQWCTENSTSFHNVVDFRMVVEEETFERCESSTAV
jgi:hypothetical protein